MASFSFILSGDNDKVILDSVEKAVKDLLRIDCKLSERINKKVVVDIDIKVLE